jgi:hypothetical protein
VENKIAGPKHWMNAGRWMRKWNFGFEIRMLGEHFAVILRKSPII